MKIKQIKLSAKEQAESRRLFGLFKVRGFSVGKDTNGYYAYTCRYRSKSFPSMKSIPSSVIKYVKSTG